MRTTNYTTSPGEHVSHAALAAAQTAKKSKCRVRFDFNGIRLEASPKKSPVTLVWEFGRCWDQRAETYRLSKEGQTAAKKRAQEVARNQDATAAAIRTLCGLCSDKEPSRSWPSKLDCLVGWLHSFSHYADDIGVDMDAAAGVKSGGHEYVALLFESAGYKQDHHVGQPPEWFNTRERMGQYIVGQAIACLRRGMAPHPVTQAFAAKYYALPSAE